MFVGKSSRQTIGWTSILCSECQRHSQLTSWLSATTLRSVMLSSVMLTNWRYRGTDKRSLASLVSLPLSCSSEWPVVLSVRNNLLLFCHLILSLFPICLFLQYRIQSFCVQKWTEACSGCRFSVVIHDLLLLPMLFYPSFTVLLVQEHQEGMSGQVLRGYLWGWREKLRLTFLST